MGLYRITLGSTSYHYVDVYADNEDDAYQIGVDRIASGDEDDSDFGEYWDEGETDLIDENATDPSIVEVPKEEPDVVY
jgi:hypothetical protein